MELKQYPSGKTALYRFDTPGIPRAMIILVHGFGEHAGRYKQWATRFNEEGISVRLFDLPGHGLSEGKHGFMSSMQLIYDTIEVIRAEIKQELPGTPVIVYGHSLGGLIVLNYLINKKPDVTGAIATAPWIRLSYEPPKIKQVLARVFCKVLPGLTQNTKLIIEHMSRDREEVASYRSDPRNHGLMSAGLWGAIIDATEVALQRAHEISVPLLLVHGRDDMIISPSSSVDIATAAPGATLKLWDGGYHELHNDLIKDEHFAFIIEWVDTLL